MSSSVLRWHSGGENGSVDKGTTQLTPEGLHALGIPEDAWLEVDQGYKEYWRQTVATVDKRYRGCDVEDIPIRDPHVDETRMTRYTQWTRLKSLTKMAEIFFWYRQVRFEAAMFSVPLTPFDSIVLEYDADGLCVPGIGVQMFAKC